MKNTRTPIVQAKPGSCLQLKFPLYILCSMSLLAFSFGSMAGINPGGSLSNFEVYNDSGIPAHGFEIQIGNATAKDFYYTNASQRYGAGSLNPFTLTTGSGVNIRWQSPFDSVSRKYTLTTPIHDPLSTGYSWQDCYLGGAGYATSGCEIYGQGLNYPYNPNLSAKGYFLVDDALNPGQLKRDVTPVAIPTLPAYSFPVAAATAPPVVVIQVEAPEPPETPDKYGDAQWMKIYKTELARPATPNDLKTNNGIVPTNAAQVEVAWSLLQASPPSHGKQARKGSSGNIKPTTRAVVRRIETYKYTGTYNAATHQATCKDLTCTAPSAGELGKFVGANNTAVNVNPDALSVTKVGIGAVSDTSRVISCGSACAAFINKGGIFNLTATAAGGSVFTGWGGACGGKQPTCAATVNGVTNVVATFKPLFTLSIGRSNNGTVIGVPAGVDRGINCGSSCSAKFAQGTIVTLTAIPPAGKAFVNWSGGCVGAAQSCSLTVNANTSVQAVFSK